MHAVTRRLLLTTLLTLPVVVRGADWGPAVEDTNFGFQVNGNASSANQKITTLNPQSGDGLVIVFMLAGVGYTVTGPSGWTLVGSDETENRSVYIYEKESDGTETDTTISWTGGNEESGSYSFLFQGDYSGGTIVDQFAFDEAAGLDDSPSIDPTDQPSTVFAGYSSQGDDSPVTVPSGMTVVREFAHAPDPNILYSAAFEDVDSAAATGVMTWGNLTGTTQHWSFNVFEFNTGGGGSPSVNDSSPQPGVTVSYTCGSPFAGNITTMTTVDGDTISAEAGATTCAADFIIPALSAYAVGGSMDDTKWSNSATWTVGDGTTTENITMQIDPPTGGFFGDISCASCPGDSLVPAGHATNDDYYCEFTTGGGVVGDAMVAMVDDPGDVVSCRTYDESTTAWTNPVSTTFEAIASLGGS